MGTDIVFRRYRNCGPDYDEVTVTSDGGTVDNLYPSIYQASWGSWRLLWQKTDDIYHVTTKIATGLSEWGAEVLLILSAKAPGTAGQSSVLHIVYWVESGGGTLKYNRLDLQTESLMLSTPVTVVTPVDEQRAAIEVGRDGYIYISYYDPTPEVKLMVSTKFGVSGSWTLVG